MKSIKILTFLTIVTTVTLSFAQNQEIENGRYQFKKGERARIIEITDDKVKVSKRNSFLEEYTISERREIEGVKQIICDIGNNQKVVITQTMNGKNIFMYKWDNEKSEPIENLKHWYVKFRSSNKLRKLKFSQTKRNW